MVTGIAESTARIKYIAGDLPVIHALGGCDTAVATYGIGKPTANRVAKRGIFLSVMDNVTAHLSDTISQATEFKTECYGKHVGSTTMTEWKQKTWAHKTCRGTASTNRKTVFTPNISRISWKCKTLPLSGVQLRKWPPLYMFHMISY